MKNFKSKVLNILLFTLISILLFGCGESTDEKDNDNKTEETSNSSDFISGVDDWTIEGDAEGGRGLIPNFSAMNGVDNSGYIYAKDDVAGGVWYFVAPSKYRGDKSIFFNGKIKFYLIQDSDMSNQFTAKDVIIENISGEKIVYTHEAYPAITWTKYEINLNTDSQWLDENGDIASDEKIKDTLSNISKLMIRGEFESGIDTGGLDGFKFLKQK